MPRGKENGGGNSGGNRGGNQGGSKRSSKGDRGLASADKETRQRVSREGGKASHGGGRGQGSGKTGERGE